MVVRVWCAQKKIEPQREDRNQRADPGGKQGGCGSGGRFVVFALEVNRKAMFKFPAGSVELRIAQNSLIKISAQFAFAFTGDCNVNLRAFDVR